MNKSGFIYSDVSGSSIQPPKYECTACITTILEKSDIKKHKELGCIICSFCYRSNDDYYKIEQEGASLNKSGQKNRCRLCCADNFLILCTNRSSGSRGRCRNAFCHSCVQRYDSEADILNHRVDRSANQDQDINCEWNCFICDKTKQVPLREKAAIFLRECSAYWQHDLDLDLSEICSITQTDSSSHQAGSVMKLKSAETVIDDDIEVITEIKKEDDHKAQASTSQQLVDSSYRDSDWTIIGYNYDDESKLRFRLTWDGYDDDFNTLEEVEYVMRDYQKVKSYLKIVKANDCFAFDSIIKNSPQLADVFRASGPKVVSNLNSIKQAGSHEKPNLIETKENNEIVNFQEKSKSLEVPVEKDCDSSSACRKRKSSLSSENQIETSTRKKSRVVDAIPPTSTSSDTSELQSSDKAPRKDLSNELAQKNIEKEASDKSSQKSKHGRSLSIESQTKSEETPVNKPQTNCQASTSEEPTISLSSFGENEKKPANELPDVECTSASTSTRSTIIISPTNKSTSSLTNDKKTSYQIDTNFNLVLNTTQSFAESTVNSQKCEVFPAQQSASVIADMRIVDHSSQSALASEESQLDTQSVTKKSSTEDLPQSPAATQAPIRSNSSTTTTTNQSNAIIKPSPKAPVSLQQTNPNLSKKQDINQISSSRSSEINKRKNSIVQEPQSASESEKNKRKENNTTNRTNQVSATLADIIPMEQVASSYKIPRLSGGNKSPTKDVNFTLQKKVNNLPNNDTAVVTNLENSSSENINKDSTTGKVVSHHSDNRQAINKQQSENPIASSSKSVGKDPNLVTKQKSNPTSESNNKQSTKREPTTTPHSTTSVSRVDRKDFEYSTSKQSSSKDAHHIPSTSSSSRDSRRPDEYRSKRRSDEVSPEPINKSRDDRYSSRNSRNIYHHVEGSSRKPIFDRLGKIDHRDQSPCRNVETDFERFQRGRKSGFAPNVYCEGSSFSPSENQAPTKKVSDVVRILLARMGNYKPLTEGEIRERKENFQTQRKRFYREAAVGPNRLVADHSYSITGSLKYMGMEERHNRGIESITQCGNHKLFTDHKTKKIVTVPVFEVKFWDHEQRDKLPYSEVVKYDMRSVQKFMRVIKCKNKVRFARWESKGGLEFTIFKAKCVEQCVNSIERKEKAAYTQYFHNANRH